MDDATLQAIRNPGLLVKAEVGFLCNSGRTVFSIQKQHYPKGDMWVVLAPDGRRLRRYEAIVDAVRYIIEGEADIESFAPLTPPGAMED